MKCIGQIWYVPCASLIESCSVPKITIDQGVQRNSPIWQSIKDPDDRRKRLIRYDTLAPKYQILVRKTLCSGLEPWEIKAQKKQEVLSERSLVDLLTIAVEQDYRRYLGLWELGDDRREKSLARAAAVVETIARYIRERGFGLKAYAPYEEAAVWIKSNWSDYSKWADVPTNAVRLKEKVMERMYGTGAMRDLPNAPGPKPVHEVIKLKREDNQNREMYLHSYPQPLAWAMQLASLGENYSDAIIIRKVQECCESQGIKAPSKGWFAGLFAKPLTKRLRTGHSWEPGSRMAQKFSAYRPIEGACHAGDAWMMDGTQVNMIPHLTPEGKWDHLWIVWVYDVYSGDVLGVTWCYGEDRFAYINALKMAVQNTGYLPYELIFDKFPGHNTDEWGWKEKGKTFTGVCKQLSDRGVTLTCTIEATGKAPIERFIGTFQDVFLQESKYYYGQGIKSTRAAAHRTSEYLTRTIKEAKLEGWNWEMAWKEVNHWLKLYRNTPVSFYSKKQIDKSPRERHDSSDKPLALTLRPEQIVQIFWPSKSLKIQREMIQMTVYKRDVFYPIPASAYSTLRYHSHVTVRYDEEDLSMVHLFDANTDAYLCALELGEKTKRYGIDKPRADANRLEFVKQEQAKAAMNQEELNALRAGGDDIVWLMQKQAPKAQREAAESRFEVERVTEQMNARFPKPKKAIPVAVVDDDIDINGFAESQY